MISLDGLLVGIVGNNMNRKEPRCMYQMEFRGGIICSEINSGRYCPYERHLCEIKKRRIK